MSLIERAVIAMSGAAIACGSANTRSLPVASAIIVHGCAAAEADVYIRGAIRGTPGDEYAISKTTINLKNTGENHASATEILGLEAVLGAEKSTEIELVRLPTMAQCKLWGYLPQLGPQGCVIGSLLPSGEKCRQLTSNEYPPDAPPPPKTGKKPVD